ncbi:hypothetical protein [Paracoccus luteus]|uniref:hypothetical protein n=1 Tax=Paracoccus luteus TaxID=2508543 RepID=UPI00106F9F4A|nr:hypothetical protein [Paracoccus luteus]
MPRPSTAICRTTPERVRRIVASSDRPVPVGPRRAGGDRAPLADLSALYRSAFAAAIHGDLPDHA